MRSLVRLAVLVSAALIALPARADNYVEIGLLRADDQPFPETAFLMQMSVGLDVEGVTAVDVQAGSLAVLLENEGGSVWEAEESFTSFEDMTATLDGTWTITVQGMDPSTSTFTFDASSLVDGNFLQTPTNVSPAQDATDVPPDFAVSWTPPPGGDTATVLAVFVEDGVDQEAISILGGIQVTDTMWQPPAPSPAGIYEVDVLYGNAAPSFVTDLGSADGIVWGSSPLGGLPFPTGRPFLLLGSDTIHLFTVVPEPAALALQLAAFGALYGLGRRRRSAARPMARDASYPVARSGAPPLLRDKRIDLMRTGPTHPAAHV